MNARKRNFAGITGFLLVMICCNVFVKVNTTLNRLFLITAVVLFLGMLGYNGFIAYKNMKNEARRK